MLGRLPLRSGGGKAAERVGVRGYSPGLGLNPMLQHKSHISDFVCSLAWQRRTNQICTRGKLGVGAAVVQSTIVPLTPALSPAGRGSHTELASRPSNHISTGCTPG